MPMVTAGLAAGSGLISGGLNFMGGLRQAALQKDAARNARLAGDIEAYGQRVSNLKLRGRQEQGYANAGVTSEGTPQTVIDDSAMWGEFAALQKQYAGRLQAFSLKQQARATTAGAIGGAIGSVGRIATGAADGPLGSLLSSGGGAGTTTPTVDYDYYLGFS